MKIQSFYKPLPKPVYKKRQTRLVRTAADHMFEALVQKGWSTKDAAKHAQSTTGLSVVTGRKMRTMGYGR